MPTASAVNVSDSEADEETEVEADNIFLAKAYFDSNEFLRAAHVLRGAGAALPDQSKVTISIYRARSSIWFWSMSRVRAYEQFPLTAQRSASGPDARRS